MPQKTCKHGLLISNSLQNKPVVVLASRTTGRNTGSLWKLTVSWVAEPCVAARWTQFIFPQQYLQLAVGLLGHNPLSHWQSKEETHDARTLAMIYNNKKKQPECKQLYIISSITTLQTQLTSLIIKQIQIKNTMKHHCMIRQKYGKNIEQPLVEMYNYSSQHSDFNKSDSHLCLANTTESECSESQLF